ncbi:MAG: hypothetical protein FWH03_01725 [Firmicutes bacterium]|nr:hypothetical protein [Bacillota bacterium]
MQAFALDFALLDFTLDFVPVAALVAFVAFEALACVALDVLAFALLAREA